MLKNIIYMTKISLNFYYYVHSLIYYYLTLDRQIILSNGIRPSTRRFYFTQQFFIYFQIRISQISRSLQSRKKMTICVQIRSRIILSMVFGYILGLIGLYTVIFHLLRGWGGVGIHCKLIPDLIESTPSKILFPT